MQLTDRIGLPNIQSVCQKLFEEHNVRSLLDLGGGGNPLSDLCHAMNIRRLNVDLAEPENSDFWTRIVNLDINDFDSIEAALHEFFGSTKIDAVIMIQSIEHLTKVDGLKVLSKIGRGQANSSSSKPQMVSFFRSLRSQIHGKNIYLDGAKKTSALLGLRLKERTV